jgi:type II restriction enzyme
MPEIMDIVMNPNLVKNYKSGSQISRLVTEKWFSDNMYCPACPSEYLAQTPPNEKVIDFYCPRCDEKYQLKGMAHPFGKKIVDSAHEPKIKMIQKQTGPNFVFLHYDMKPMKVRNMLIIPGHFLVPEVIEKRPPLRLPAQRAGWVGSNILLEKMPPDARLYVIKDFNIMPETTVRESWRKFLFLKDMRLDSRGWLNDVLAATRKLGKTEFTLEEIYGFEEELSQMHPDNLHVREKIRQQLQVLRDKGIVDFLGRGKYRLNS